MPHPLSVQVLPPPSLWAELQVTLPSVFEHALLRERVVLPGPLMYIPSPLESAVLSFRMLPFEFWTRIPALLPEAVLFMMLFPSE